MKRNFVILLLIVITNAINGHSALGGQPVLRVPYPNGVSYRVSQGNGGSYSHNLTSTMYAIDFDTPNSGDPEPVVAAAEGDAYVFSSSCYGNFVKIAHGDNYYTIYAHLSSVAISNGTHVHQGEVIGYEGTTGTCSDGDHIHFGLHTGDATVSTVSNSVLAESMISKDNNDPSFRFYESNDFQVDHYYLSDNVGITNATTWLYNNSSFEGWTAYDADAQALQTGQWWIDPKVTPRTRIVSPVLDRAISSVNYLKLQIRNRGIDSNGRIYIATNTNGHIFKEQNSMAFNLPNDSAWRWLRIPFNKIPGWSGSSSLDRFRFDPVSTSCQESCQDNVEIEAILIRLDQEAPVIVSGPNAQPSQPTPINSFTFEWNYGQDPPINDGSNTGDGSGIDHYEIRFNNGSWSGPYYSTSWSGAVSNIQTGENTFYVHALDVVGNQSVDSWVHFYFNPTTCESAPNLSFDTPNGSVPCGWTVANQYGALYSYPDGGAPGGGTKYVSFTHVDGSNRNAIGRSATSVGLVPDGPYYRLGFWYRASTTSASFSWRLGDAFMTGSSELLFSAITPAAVGAWTWFSSPPFRITSSQLSAHPNLGFYFDVGAMGTIDIDNVVISQDTGCGLIMVGPCQ
jgi:murein DD-endopeptidase MepM/ murein hydrolase activator NlpD